MAETHVVTLGDASVTTEDLALLMPPAWLNDRLLSFWFEHLRLHRANSCPEVALLPPSLAYLLCVVEPDALPALLSELRLARAALVLVALNSAAAGGAAAAARHHAAASAAGTHWSLLVFRRATHTFRHYDSARGAANAAVARAVAARLQPLVGAPGATVSDAFVPRQRNSYDCGAYVCVFAERFVRRFMASRGAGALQQQQQQQQQQLGGAAEAAGDVEFEPIEDEDVDVDEDGVDEDAERLAVVVTKKRQEIGMVVSLVLHEQQLKKAQQQRHLHHQQQQQQQQQSSSSSSSTQQQQQASGPSPS